MTHLRLELADGTAPVLREAGHSPAPAVHPLASGSHLRTVHEFCDFLALETEWRRLETGCQSHRNIFQTFDWLKTWAEVYSAAPGSQELHVILGYRDSRLVFAWPLMRTRSGPLTILRWMSEPLSQYGDVLIASGECAKAWMTAALIQLRRTPGVDAIRLRHVRCDAAATPFLQMNFRNARLAEQAPWLDLTRFADEAAYEARYNSSQRKRRKKIRKALEDAFGPVAFTVLKPGHAGDLAIDQAIAEKSEWIEERGRQNRALSRPGLSTFLKRLARSQDGAMDLVVTALTAGGKPVSWEIGLRHAGTHFAFITSHVNALTDYSPARLHMDLSQRHALNHGMRAFDLMLPHDAYKDSWSSGHTDTADFHLPLSAGGWAYGVIYLERLRPMLRHAYYRMSPGLLRLLKPIVGH